MNSPGHTTTFKMSTLPWLVAVISLLLTAGSAGAAARIAASDGEGVGQAFALDGDQLFWVSSKNLIKRTNLMGGEQATLFKARNVTRIVAAGGYFAYLVVDQSTKSKTVRYRIYRSERGGAGLRRVVSTSLVDHSTSAGYRACGEALVLRDMSEQGTLVYGKQIMVSARRSCRGKIKVSSELYSVTAAENPLLPSAEKRILKTSDYLLAASAERAMTVAGSGNRAMTIHDLVTKKQSKLKLSMTPKRIADSFYSSFDAAGNAFFTTRTLSGKPARDTFVYRLADKSGGLKSAGYAQPYTISSASRWRYQACGDSLIRWSDRSLPTTKNGELSVVHNPVNPAARPPRKIVDTSRLIGTVDCDAQRVAFALAGAGKKDIFTEIWLDEL